MKEMRDKRLVVDLLDTNAMLARFNEKMMKSDDAPLAFDGHVVPNMLDVGCTGKAANGNLPVVVGQAKDELDTLKFQFPLKAMIQNMVKRSVANTSLDMADTKSC